MYNPSVMQVQIKSEYSFSINFKKGKKCTSHIFILTFKVPVKIVFFAGFMIPTIWHIFPPQGWKQIVEQNILVCCSNTISLHRPKSVPAQTRTCAQTELNEDMDLIKVGVWEVPAQSPVLNTTQIS